MSKKVLAVYFTQSGQLGEIIRQLYRASDVSRRQCRKITDSPAKKFPFPWTTPVFFEAMPESVKLIPAELEPFTLRKTTMI